MLYDTVYVKHNVCVGGGGGGGGGGGDILRSVGVPLVSVPVVSGEPFPCRENHHYEYYRVDIYRQ